MGGGSSHANESIISSGIWFLRQTSKRVVKLIDVKQQLQAWDGTTFDKIQSPWPPFCYNMITPEDFPPAYAVFILLAIISYTHYIIVLKEVQFVLYLDFLKLYSDSLSNFQILFVLMFLFWDKIKISFLIFFYWKKMDIFSGTYSSKPYTIC